MADDAGRFGAALDAVAFDWKNPDYLPVFDRRARALRRLRADIKAEVAELTEAGEPLPTVPGPVRSLLAYYRDGHMADFLNDWGVTVDPRNVEIDLPPVMPFVLFDKQREWVDFVIRKWRERKPGLVEKSRDVGVSWLSVGLAAGLCIVFDGMQVGFGSRKEEYVDKADDPKSLFWKARAFVAGLPRELRGGWDRRHYSAHMRLVFPTSGSTMTGEAGANIGRGDRTSIYFVDESAHIEHAKSVDAALSQTTNCRIDQSSVNGMDNVFADKRWGGKIEVFVFDWRDDPRKDAAWYAKQEEELDPVVLAQEVDRDYVASVEGLIIPGEWARAAIDAHVKLGYEVTGDRFAGLDIADEGKDLNAYVSARGWLIDHVEEWSGKGSDIFATTAKAFAIRDTLGDGRIRYDSDGIGASVRGNGRVLNEQRGASPRVILEAYRGSGEIVDPKRKAPGTDRLNEDFFANFKAQAWWAARQRFYRTWLMVTQAEALKAGKITKDQLRHAYNADELVSISSECKLHLKLVAELSQATFDWNGAGKMVVDKAPDDRKSPNLADGAVIRLAPMKGRMMVSRDAVENARGYRHR